MDCLDTETRHSYEEFEAECSPLLSCRLINVDAISVAIESQLTAAFFLSHFLSHTDVPNSVLLDVFVPRFVLESALRHTNQNETRLVLSWSHLSGCIRESNVIAIS